MGILSTDLFKFMGKVNQSQVDAMYRILNAGAKIEDVADLIGYIHPKIEVAPVAKSGFILGEKSLKFLAGVHPDLVRVVKRAIEISEVDFTVIAGVRSKEEAYVNYGKGRTVEQLKAKNVPAKYAQPNLPKVTWLNSPLGSKHMTGHAIDLAPFPIDWKDLKSFDKMAAAMFQAARELGIEIRWGADWDGDGKYREKGENDSPHFEL